MVPTCAPYHARHSGEMQPWHWAAGPGELSGLCGPQNWPLSQEESSKTAQKSPSLFRFAEVLITCIADRLLTASMDIIQMLRHLRLSHPSSGPIWLKILSEEKL